MYATSTELLSSYVPSPAIYALEQRQTRTDVDDGRFSDLYSNLCCVICRWPIQISSISLLICI